MSLKQEIFRIKLQFVETLYAVMEKIARWFFGYPNVTGMKIKPYTAEKLTLINHVRELPCLLYTSPSPRDQRGSRMPSSA